MTKSNVLYNYSWSGDLIPLESCLSSELRADLLPSLTEQGTYAGKLYGVGYYQGSHGIFARRSVLETNGIRIPTGPMDAWTAKAFTTPWKRSRRLVTPTPST